jgi:hypothetical protein
MPVRAGRDETSTAQYLPFCIVSPNMKRRIARLPRLGVGTCAMVSARGQDGVLLTGHQFLERLRREPDLCCGFIRVAAGAGQELGR